MHLTGIHLIGTICLIDVYLTGVHLIGVHLLQACATRGRAGFDFRKILILSRSAYHCVGVACGGVL
jgi:hypothetical protein